MRQAGHITVLGVFVADTTYRADRAPSMGETLLGNSFALGPGGKGSNQAVAAARLGGDVSIITRLDDDAFADMAQGIWSSTGVKSAALRDPDTYTGAASIFVEDASGDNAIIVCPGAASDLSPRDLEQNADLVRSSSIFMTQLEQPLEAAEFGLSMAREAGVTTILNPAPAAKLSGQLLELCDFATPNETEAGMLTGINVETVEDAKKAAGRLVEMGVGSAVITLGADGALYHGPEGTVHVPAFDAGPVVETTGAGDAFNGGLAVGLAENMSAFDAVYLGCATASLSVTRPGTSQSMPDRQQVDALLKQ
ncbi:MAG: ribokinase [Rhizobiaceae bacterium]